jgi:uncharacterized protein
MAPAMQADLTDAELDELDGLLAAAPAPCEPLSVPMLDGYLVGTLVQPRVVAREAWLPGVFGEGERTLPDDSDSAWLARTCELIERRRDAVNAAIGEWGAFDPIVVDADQLPPVSEYDPIQSPISRTLAPWAAGFFWAQERFPDLGALGEDAVDTAFARIARHLPPQDDDERALVATLDREHPLADLDAALDDLTAACVELWDLTVRERFRGQTVRRQGPKVGRNDPCPCGSGRKYKHCHGREA